LRSVRTTSIGYSAVSFPDETRRMQDENERAGDDGTGSIKDAVFGEANALGGGDIEGAGAGPDAQSAGPADTNEGTIGDTGEHPATASDIGGGDDLGEDAG
jgi:hypothetical protein